MAKKGEEMIPFPGEMGINEFKGKPIRKVFEEGEWFFSISDVVGAIAETDRPSKYWSDLKRKLTKEGSGQLSENIGQLKMTGPDGKEHPTDAANAETMFRIIQSIGSPRAEPFKRWLGKVAFERIQEFQNPELGIQRAILDYQIQGHSDDWIKARIRTVLSRKELTSELASRGVTEGKEYAILTNVISQETFNIAIKTHKEAKGLAKGHNRRDHMTDMELVLTMLGETSTAELACARDSQGFSENKELLMLEAKLLVTRGRTLRGNWADLLSQAAISFPREATRGNFHRAKTTIVNKKVSE